jgi:hypothetical protein
MALVLEIPVLAGQKRIHCERYVETQPIRINDPQL